MKVSLRKTLKKDWNYILSLRNNDKFRENFYQQHRISKTEHFEYLIKQKLLQDFKHRLNKLNDLTLFIAHFSNMRFKNINNYINIR